MLGAAALIAGGFGGLLFFLFRYQLTDRPRYLWLAAASGMLGLGTAAALVKPELMVAYFFGGLALHLAGSLVAIGIQGYLRYRHLSPARPLTKALLILPLCVTSALMLLLAGISFGPEWRDAKGPGWFYLTLDGWAGFVLVPHWVLASVFIGRAIWNNDYARRSALAFVMAATNLAIAGWYVLACLAFRFVSVGPAGIGNDLVEQGLYTAFPGVTAVGLAFHVARTWRQGEFQWPPRWLLGGWFVSLAAAIAAKYPLALKLYLSLPAAPPHHDCFVVSAALRGHPWLVGRQWDAAAGAWTNRQLARFRAFEANWQHRWPASHRRFRAVYNLWGPGVARVVRGAIVADAVYLLLKPLEWLAWGLTRRRRATDARMRQP